MADANLFARFAQPVRSVNDYLDQYDQQDARREDLAARRQQNAIQALTMRRQAEADARATDERNAFEQLARQYGTDRKAFIGALESSGRPGFMTQAQALRKGDLDAANTQSQIDGRASENAKRQAEIDKQRREAAATQIAALNSPQEALSLLKVKVDAKEVPPELAPAFESLIRTDPKWQIKLALAVGDPAKLVETLKPHIQYISNGKVQTPVDTNALSNPNGQKPIVMTTTPGEDQSAAVSVANNKRTVGASYANAAAARDQAQAVRDAAKITARASDETGMRKEFADLPEVKKFKEAAPAYKAVVEAAKTNNPQADINLIYGLAKLYDPNSVVREGEYATIANSQAIPEWLKGQAQRLVGGGRLTDGTKKQIVEQANIRYRTMKGDVDGARSSYDDIAKKRGLDPSNVFPKIGAGSEAGPSVTNW